jgi:hypothetical protein
VKIRIHVDRLVLEGWSVSSAQALRVRAGMETELARLIETHGIPGALRHSGSVPRIPVPQARVRPDSPAQTGRAIAASVFRGLAEPRS